MGAALTSFELAFSSVALAQEFPSKPITIIVPYAAGGAADSLARIMGNKLTAILGQPVIVDVRPGANSNIGTNYALRAPADGSTWVVAAPALTVNPFLYKEGVWKIKDFTVVGAVVSAPAVVVVPSELRIASMADFVKLVKASPGKYNYGNPGIGSSLHMNTEILKQETGIDLTSVIYKGQPPALIALLRNEVAMMIPSIGLVTQHISAGKLKPLAVVSNERSSDLPNIPTLTEAGYPKANIVPWYGLAVPAKTPRAIAERINSAINQALLDANVQQKFHHLSMVTEQPRTLPEIDALIKRDAAKYAEVIQKGNLTAE
ncbi:Bug family tripartite tricarboxylate transporter substrate binding protein [Comamonas thiooxydans]|uniref:Bug family tripartite tricarboxylate transporter substrate binding protein n=1 Tax=Comamonas thiooxydans TaxID=363952 RepID=UPI0007C5C649|nr:tripartite tricarboxylate transporter substrate-binding protein [Comamonas thiooxydans]